MALQAGAWWYVLALSDASTELFKSNHWYLFRKINVWIFHKQGIGSCLSVDCQIVLVQQAIMERNKFINVTSERQDGNVC